MMLYLKVFCVFTKFVLKWDNCEIDIYNEKGKYSLRYLGTAKGDK